MDLAQKLIDQLAAKGFHPEQYRDHYRDRLREAVERKLAGEETTIVATAPPRAQVIDLMQALKQSLARGEREPAARAAAAEPAARARRRTAAAAAGGGGRGGVAKKK
jgi:DNA end-binding protein Ku